MTATKPAKKSTRTKGSDAVAMLKADHRTVAGWFADYQKARTTARKQKLATQICEALRVHTTIEEEIFYPAFLKATADKAMHHEAELEHLNSARYAASFASSTVLLG